MDFKKIAMEQQDYAVSMRREFHQHPEITGEEVWTSGRIAEELEKMGIPYERVNELNVVGLIDTKRTGKTIAIRADIDALPMQQENDVPYKSKIDGKMHSCGHDAHAAILLATAKALIANLEHYSGKIYLCFQYGEERGVGAAEIVEHLKEKGGVDHVFAVHVSPLLPTGAIFMKDKGLFAGTAAFEIIVTGKGGHGSQPHTAIDPIKPLCEIIPRIAALPVNRINTFDPVVISPCTFNSGTATNIIPETATSTGTIRFFSYEAFDKVTECIDSIVKSIAESYGAKGEFKLLKRGVGVPPIINSVSANAVGKEAAEEAGLKVITGDPFMGSDNYSLFVEAFDGFYAMLGLGYPGKPVAHHNPHFDLDEAGFYKGVEFFLRCADKFLK